MYQILFSELLCKIVEGRKKNLYCLKLTRKIVSMYSNHYYTDVLPQTTASAQMFWLEDQSSNIAVKYQNTKFRKMRP